METLRLLIVEDESIMSQALANSLQNLGISQIETANSASKAMQLFRSFNPEVCLIDVELRQGPTGIDVSHAMRRLNPKVGIVFLTSLADPRLVDSRIPELPEGSIYMMKSAVKDLQEVFDSLKLARTADFKKIKSRDDQKFLDLTKSQFEIMRLIAQGNSNAEISKVRVTTVKSTENAIARLAKRLGIPSSTSASQRVLIARKYSELIGKI
ncbi:CitB Response regulator containing a CheY-like receiver domain and an HTH DNA-binding domain [Candidatus Nanopelagicaceae bacterium]